MGLVGDGRCRIRRLALFVAGFPATELAGTVVLVREPGAFGVDVLPGFAAGAA